MTTSSLEIYLVGGAVRDKLLGLPHKEKDWVVVGATEQDMINRGFRRVGKDFPVFLHPETQEEYALARTERKKGKGYYGFECHASPDVTLEQDLLRRDITINAMAEDPKGHLIDPYKGHLDLQNKIIRHVSPAFLEDPVRILRAARFMARFAPLGFQIAEETKKLMRDMVENGEVDALVPERVWQEMERALKEIAPSQFILTLRECGSLERLWPELNKLWGVPQPEKHHPEIDTGVHVMLALQIACQLTQDPVVRFAALCHDLGKGETPPEEWPSHRGHEETGVPLIKKFCKKYRVPNEYRDLAVLVSRYHLHCHRVNELKPSTLLKLLKNLDIFRKPERFEKFLLACEGDARGRKGLEDNIYVQAGIFRKLAHQLRAVSIDYDDTQAKEKLEGKEIGEALDKKRLHVIKQFFKVTPSKE